MSRRRIPLWVHVPWYLLSLVGAVSLHRCDGGGWPWGHGAYPPYRCALAALVVWGYCSRWHVDFKLRRRPRRVQ